MRFSIVSGVTKKGISMCHGRRVYKTNFFVDGKRHKCNAEYVVSGLPGAHTTTTTTTTTNTNN